MLICQTRLMTIPLSEAAIAGADSTRLDKDTVMGDSQTWPPLLDLAKRMRPTPVSRLQTVAARTPSVLSTTCGLCGISPSVERVELDAHVTPPSAVLLDWMTDAWPPPDRVHTTTAFVPVADIATSGVAELKPTVDSSSASRHEVPPFGLTRAYTRVVPETVWVQTSRMVWPSLEMAARAVSEPGLVKKVGPVQVAPPSWERVMLT